MLNYSKYPICDTDIWVNLCLGEIENELFRKYIKVFFVSTVRDEIIRWKKGKYPCISEKLSEKIKHDLALIIEVEELDESDRKIIEKQLIEDAGYPLGFNTPLENRHNMGEYMSAIVADHFGILLMKTEDGLFKEGGRGKELYPDLKVKCWRDTVNDLVKIKDRERIIEKVRRDNIKMNKEKERYEMGQATIDEILKLASFFNNK